MKISAKTKICIIIGDPVEHSLSPFMHNAGYKALGIDDEFVFIASKVASKDLEKVIKALKVMNVRGITCTIPHKIDILKYLDEIDETAKQIGAVNTVVNCSGKLKGYNTDWLGAAIPLENHIDLSGKKVALIGAGGAAHAMGFGVLEKGAELTIFNRTIEKAYKLQELLVAQKFNKVNVESIKNIVEIGSYDIILNSTNLGMGEHIDKSPIPKEYLQKHHIVFDAVYMPFETKLLKEARQKGATCIKGVEMLLHQGMAQFEIYTGYKAPEEVMRKALLR